jgi:hypothetical protein
MGRPWFKPESSHVGSFVEEVTMGQVLSDNFGFLCQAFTSCPALIIIHDPGLVQYAK